jgi:hypothetical protein
MYNNFESMKGSLLEQICAVLDKHKIAYEKSGVQKNLDAFCENKATLLNLLRKHPNWNENALAVIFDAGDIRTRSEEEIEKRRLELESIAAKCFENGSDDGNEFFSDESVAKFKKALKYLCDQPRFVTDSFAARNIKRNTGIDCKVGQRASRIIDKLCKEYEIGEHKDYFSVFARLADALNPLAIEHKAVLSLHPCDFLEMASGEGWLSDFRLDAQKNKGEYIAGIFAHMNDSGSMVFYTVDNAVTAQYSDAAKINSEIFCYENGILLQARLYPEHSDEAAKTTFRNLVQKIMAECLEQPNLWLLKKAQYSVNQAYKTIGTISKSDDFCKDKFRPTISLLKNRHPDGITPSTSKLVIGHEAYCLKCGNAVVAGHRVYCASCA